MSATANTAGTNHDIVKTFVSETAFGILAWTAVITYLIIDIKTGFSLSPKPSSPWPTLADGDNMIFGVLIGTCAAIFGSKQAYKRRMSNSRSAPHSNLYVWSCRIGGSVMLVVATFVLTLFLPKLEGGFYVAPLIAFGVCCIIGSLLRDY